MTRLARRLRQRADSGLSPSLGAALATIDCHGPLTPSQLAERERVQRPTATRLIARLTEEELVAREDHPDDRRSHRIAVTPAGRALVQETRQRKTAYLAQALEHLDAEDQATLTRAAKILEGVLEEGASSPNGSHARVHA
ncbi:MAG: transcriptional regulator, MarR family [Solirubrobacterales bacterium]|nr:transcriptional regulator, MarR family [Solirubrobacterales bacterium]